MDCLVKYCGKPATVEGGVCKGHLKAWQKSVGSMPDEVARGMRDAWLAEQSDLLLDVCPTPYELALAICRRVAEEAGDMKRILEPSAGDGVFVRAARKVWPNAQITAVEIRKECRQQLVEAGADSVYIEDLASIGVKHWGGTDLVIGNPPFAVAEEHIRSLLFKMDEGAHLAFLLRIGFLGSKERLDFWAKHPEEWFAPIVPRPSFKLNKHGKPGTDSQEYGLFCWRAFEGTGPTYRLPHLVWSKPRAAKKSQLLVDILAPDLE